ncbi:hypothetical protein DMA11_19710 [Marinilabiliaceae bacterium JC017]|nr:hypothetical protein DMA11_19710 [Marinilabiliaceae bacterium JC017]
MRLFVSTCMLLMLLYACSKSVLSDVEISDPDLLKVKVKIEQDAYNDKEVQVFIRDKNNHPVELRNGKVVVNGCKLDFERASVNGLEARGYMYTPDNHEQIFQITIFWNHCDSHSFIISAETGFPGFITNESHWCNYCNSSNASFHSGRYELKPSPFYKNRIKVEYRILE